jgi:predicted cobalt transporter CbtA
MVEKDICAYNEVQHDSCARLSALLMSFRYVMLTRAFLVLPEKRYSMPAALLHNKAAMVAGIIACLGLAIAVVNRSRLTSMLLLLILLLLSPNLLQGMSRSTPAATLHSMVSLRFAVAVNDCGRLTWVLLLLLLKNCCRS